ncbi:MAG: diphosphomevalonate decarboxylase [Maribacter sp.]|nr:diphosphomevalonate decarboxylase [Maribacter sp.]
MTENDFVPAAYTHSIQEGFVTWKAPSNIALIKYWGKTGTQIPANPSISFTLDGCATTTTLKYRKMSLPNEAFSFEIWFEGSLKNAFKPKIETFFKRIETYLPFLKDYHITIETSNTFPHSSGIASSASGMAALALCLLDLEKQLYPAMDPLFFYKKASFIARLGSGSASRSIEGALVLWGAHQETRGSSDLYAIKYPYQVHKVFEDYNDTILLVEEGEKQVSSSVGHDLMQGHPYADRRFAQAHENISKLKDVFASGDLTEFIAIVESEALTLHAMMMTSRPYYLLMKPNTLSIIDTIWEFRRKSKTHVCFTLDAGANVHLLYPESEKEEVIQFIKDELVVYCENGHYICDGIGLGAQKM